MLSNAYFLAKFRFDTAENEPAKNLQNFRKMHFSKNAFLKNAFFENAFFENRYLRSTDAPELADQLKKLLKESDTNGDGTISKPELASFVQVRSCIFIAFALFRIFKPHQFSYIVKA